ncbi:MAG: polysaccharide deacetylase family protein [Candidatus Nanoarchaeia archaeon]
MDASFLTNSALDFLPLGAKILPKRIYLNTTQQVIRNKVLILHVDPKLKPHWSEKESIPVFIPNLYKSVVGDVLAFFEDPLTKQQYPALVKVNNSFIFNFDPKETIDFLTAEKYVRKHKPLQSKLPFHYHKIPFRFYVGKVQSKLYSLRKKEALFPSWPFEYSVEFIRALFSYCTSQLQKNKATEIWPKHKKIAFCLTHDVDTGQGLKRVKPFADLEAKHDFSTTWFFVGKYYPHNHTFLQQLVDQGNEIGCHGYNHDGKLAYLPPHKIKERLNACLPFIQRYNITGFRTPSMISSETLSNILPSYFSYESSYADTELVSPDANNRGSCTLFPYYKNNFLQIPHTLPMDSTLLFLGYTPQQILSAWIEKLELIKRIGGLALLDTHTEPHFSGQPKMIPIYKQFLDVLESQKKEMWMPTVGELANHWKKKFN